MFRAESTQEVKSRHSRLERSFQAKKGEACLLVLLVNDQKETCEIIAYFYGILIPSIGSKSGITGN